MSKRWLQNSFLPLLCISAILAGGLVGGCSDNNPIDSDPPEETEMVTKQLVAVDGNGSSIASAVFYDVDADARLENPVEREKGTRLDIRGEADGYQSATQAVTFSSDGEVAFSLIQENPDEVTITYEIVDTDGAAVDGAELTTADTLVSTGPNGSVTVPYSETSITFCGSAAYYKQTCREVQPTEDQPITLTLPRETISITITPEIVGYDDLIPNSRSFPHAATKNTVYKVMIGDSTWVDNLAAHDNSAEFISNPNIREGLATTFTYPAGPEPIEVSMRTVYVPKEGHAHSDGHFLNVAEGMMELSGDSDNEITLELAHIPACRDGVDNTFSGRMDANEPGCLDTWTSTSTEPGTDGFVYEPEDDNEQLRVATLTTGFYATKDFFVSGKDAEREIFLFDAMTPTRPQFQVAIKIENRFTKLVSADQAGEEFAMQIRNGPTGNLHTVNTTGIVLDEGNDGWTEVTIPLSREYFNNGNDYEFRVIHATKVRGEPTTDGDDDVIIFKKERDDYFIIRAIYEPEELPEEAAQKLRTGTVGDVEITDTVADFNP
jgi:hypothetical protein